MSNGALQEAFEVTEYLVVSKWLNMHNLNFTILTILKCTIQALIHAQRYATVTCLQNVLTDPDRNRVPAQQ